MKQLGFNKADFKRNRLQEYLKVTKSRVLTNLFKWSKNPDRLNQTTPSKGKNTHHNNFILAYKST